MLQTEMKRTKESLLRSQLQTPHEGRVPSEEATRAGGQRAPPPGALRFARDR